MLATAPMASRRANRWFVPHQQHERGRRRTDRRQDHERQGPRGQPVVEVPGVGAQHEEAGEGDHPGHDGGGDGPPPEVRHHLVVGQAAGVPHQVDRRQVGHHHDGEHAAEDRGRVDPAVHGVAGLAAGRHATRRDAAGHGAHAVRHQHRREGEGGAEVAPVAGAEHGLAEGEARAAQHDAERGEGQGHEQRQRDRRVRLGRTRSTAPRRQKISQTWFASHTGPIEWSMISRGRSPRSAPAGERSQKPAPKSAPPNSA